MMKNIIKSAAIPMRVVGPVKIIGTNINEEVNVPLATFETPLWFSVSRGAKISRLCSGIHTVFVKESMTRSILLEALDAGSASAFISKLKMMQMEMQTVVAASSRFAVLQDFNFQLVGNLIYLRFSFSVGDAAGHNMATKASEALQNWILQKHPELKYVSISANYCTDKKVSAVNGILGRGKYVIAEMLIPRKICKETLRSLPDQIVNLNIKKNLIGSILAGSLRSANAHFANILLAFYLATGQDAANIIEGSQGIVHAELRGDDLYFSVTLPNIIVGTIGNGKELDFVKENLDLLGCVQTRKVGENSRRLAEIIAATVLCGELSLLAAQTNMGELMESHIAIERKKQEKTKAMNN